MSAELRSKTVVLLKTPHSKLITAFNLPAGVGLEVVERGAQDMQSEMERFPRLFRGADGVPGLTWPTMVIGGGDATKGEVPERYISTLAKLI